MAFVLPNQAQFPRTPLCFPEGNESEHDFSCDYDRPTVLLLFFPFFRPIGNYAGTLPLASRHSAEFVQSPARCARCFHVDCALSERQPRTRSEGARLQNPGKFERFGGDRIVRKKTLNYLTDGLLFCAVYS